MMKRWMISSTIIVEADNKDIAKRTILEFVMQTSFVHKVEFNGEPILLKEPDDDNDSINPNEADMGTTKRD